MKMIVICSLLGMQLTLALTAVVGLVWGTLYLIRCVNIARRLGA